ncbi:MucBP domain-containing protein [Lactiplantibacillus paraxiangfangensis]|uniref:MucBP domain-containing protein n=1 Tax=Lactiplantibacillus paraxiangfangensis TaxID=3076224 RepID=UPI0030C75CE8
MVTNQLSRTRWKTVSLVVLSFSTITALSQLSVHASSPDPFSSLTQSSTPVTPLATQNLTSLALTTTTSEPITGTFGSSAWSLQDGTLTIGPGDFANNTTDKSPWKAYNASITKIEITGPVTFNTAAAGLFAGLSNLTQIDGLDQVDTSRTTNLNDLFYADSQLMDLTGVEHWDTSKVKTIDRTFFATALVGTLDLSHWDVGSLTSSSMTFCRAGAFDDNSQRLFKLLNLSGWDFQAPKVSLATFGYQLQALSIDTSDWQNTSHITNMESMFTLAGINNIDISSFDMRNLSTSYGGTWRMFNSAMLLKEIKLGPNSKLAGTGLRSVSETNKYTGYWQNIGTGTASQPNGDQVLTTDQLVSIYDGNSTPAVDTFVWQPKAAEPVTVNYVDQDDPTHPIKSATTITGAIDDPFTITPPDIAGYTYQGTQDDVPLTGTISGTAQTITLNYAKQGQVTVNYQDEAGTTIAPSKTMTGDLGTSYEIEPQAIDGYNYLSGNLTGTFTSSDQTVTLTYRKIPTEGSITVNYLDSDGHVLAKPTTMMGKLGSAYTIEPLTIDGYTFESGQLTGTYTTTSQSVNLIYRKQVAQGTVTVNYVDEQGKQLAESTTMTGPVATDYTIEKKAIDGYTFLQGDLTGQFTTTAKTVTLTYRKDAVAQGKVTVSYLDDQGKTLAPATSLTGDVDTPYVVSQPNIAGYTYHHAEGNLTGTFAKDDQAVTLIYHATEEKQGQVIVKYQTTDGQTLAPDTELTGTIAATYTITPPTFKDYQYQHADGGLTGQFSEKSATVTLTYAKQAAKLGQVIVNYLDLDGHTLAPQDTLTGPLETAYTTAVKAIAGYTHVKTTGAATGTFNEQAQTVSYFYQQQTPDKDHRKLTGQDFTMVVDGPAPTASDFKAVAQDKHGQALSVRVDLSQTNRHKVGTYPVTLSTTDGQTLLVRLHVQAAPDSGDNGDGDGNSTEPPVLPTDPSGEPDLVKPDQPGTPSKKPETTKPLPTSPIKTVTTAKVQTKSTTDKALPATNESRTRWIAVAGLLGLIGLGVKFFKRF